MNTSRNQPVDRKMSQPTPSNLTYYIVTLISGVVGLLSYNAGASLEAALTRVVIVLLVCTILGYGVNVVLWLSFTRQPPVPAASAPAPRGQTGMVGSRIDLETNDDAQIEARAPQRAQRLV
jgi:hypothetical protein